MQLKKIFTFIFRRFQFTSILCLTFLFSFSQNEKSEVAPITNDTTLLNTYAKLETFYGESNMDSSIYYCYKALEIAKKLNQPYYQGFFLCDLAYNLINKGDYATALKYLTEATRISENKNLSNYIIQTPFIQSYIQKDSASNRKELLGWIKNSLGILYGLTGSPDKKLQELIEAKNLVEPFSTDMFLLAGISSNIVEVYMQQGKLDSALYFQRETMAFESKSPRQTYAGASLSVIGDIFQQEGKTDSAKKYLFQALDIIRSRGEDLSDLGYTTNILSILYYNNNQFDSGIYFAKEAIASYNATGVFLADVLEPYTNLALNFAKNKNYDSAYKYILLSKTLGDSLNNVQIENLSKFQRVGFEEKLSQQEKENTAIATANRNRIIFLLAVILAFSGIAFISYRNYKSKLQSNKILQKTLDDLKSTQNQLVQSEKMASLGELTAGIAHEIQNPLNFVNNFSEVNTELIEELKTEKLKPKNERDENLENEILKDIAANEEKINHHGKRADAIVKGMLLHSRKNTGQKEPTDINALCDEYLRLSYHGLRAKDKSFNADFKMDLDESIGKIDIVRQDMGRVLLNLFNNAFYACTERQALSRIDVSRSAVNEKLKTQSIANTDNYKPLVSVQTKKLDDKLEIKVIDNGNGIPQNILEKIFQPFFTTKPTGQGTGLGLSLSYDIVKAHGGEIKVETKEAEGTTFIIRI